MFPVPLDPVPTWTIIAGSVFGTAALLGGAAAVLCVLSRKHAGIAAIVLWSVVWGPHDARIAGWDRVGWAPAIIMGATAPYAPTLVLSIGVASGALGPALRRRAEPAGMVAPTRQDPSRDTRPDILLITVDTVRADAGLMNVGKWTSQSPFTPTRGWTHFTTAVAPAPWTLPSLHSILTSMPVRKHGGGLPTTSGQSARMGGSFGVPYVLQQAGYETVAVVSNPHISP